MITAASLLDYAFFRNALLGVVIIGIAAGIIGTYVVTRRMVSMAGGITHACFGGLGLGYFLGINPVALAALTAIAAATAVERLSSKMKIREDSAIGVIWAGGMALGVLFVYLTPGYVPELNSFLFGNILTITATDLWLFAAFTAALIAGTARWFPMIVACAFDRDFARVGGLPVTAVNLAMTVATALCIVLAIRLVGIMLLISMLTLPVMAAENLCTRYRTIMLTSVALSVATSVAGLLAATAADIPASAGIVLIQLTAWAALTAIRKVRTAHKQLSE